MIGALLLALASPASAEGMDGLFLRWREVGREATRRELSPERPERSEAEARALGVRVGAAVAGGDCDGGERMAREAGDAALVRAVQTHCRGLIGAGSRR